MVMNKNVVKDKNIVKDKAKDIFKDKDMAKDIFIVEVKVNSVYNISLSHRIYSSYELYIWTKWYR